MNTLEKEVDQLTADVEAFVAVVRGGVDRVSVPGALDLSMRLLDLGDLLPDAGEARLRRDLGQRVAMVPSFASDNQLPAAGMSG